jgi:hypothetical protein
MTYASGSLIQASDFNTFVGVSASPSTAVNAFNTVWATGTGKYGLGQPVVSNVSTGNLVTYNDWATLINNSKALANHQGTSVTSLTAPSSGDTINYLSALSTNLSSLYSAKNNATAQGASATTSTTNNTAWSSGITFTHTITFDSGDKARYFFNGGGQIALTFSHPSGTGINALFNTLALNCGTVVLSASSDGQTIAATSYNGTTRIGGAGNAPTIINAGYYNLTTSFQQVFKQLASGSPAGYVGSFISVNVKSNGTVGTNSDNGSIITVQTLWSEVPGGLVAASGTATTCTIRPPSLSYISQSWGAISVSGSVTGS